MTTSTWDPTSGEWNTAANWSPSGVPGGSVTFAGSSRTAISVTAGGAKVDGIAFAEDAPGYTLTFGPGDAPALTIGGPGVSNRSGQQQSFIVAATSTGFNNPQLKFVNAATAGGADLFYCAGPESEQGYGGGVICFCDTATAGAASFKAWTGAATPPKHHTVGGEISFCDAASAESARFTVYGSLGDDGDTFGNVVFHDTATAANGTFSNIGGTVPGGDGGNTQFYGSSTAAHGVFHNWGGSHQQANGGDVAFDGTAEGGQGVFHNYAAKVAGAYGGVTSFNNNPPSMEAQGASAGQGAYFNYGARAGEQGGGGHLTFSAKYGSATAANARIVNYGSVLEARSSAGHTLFSINLPTEYSPTAGNATVWNHPAASAQGAGGYTAFSVYGSGEAGAQTPAVGDTVPTAGEGTFLNLGGYLAGAAGGYTEFSGASRAGQATLIAYGGTHGGGGGRILFYGESSGEGAKVQLFGNGELDIAGHTGGLTLGSLALAGGTLAVRLGTHPTGLTLTGPLTLDGAQVTFRFRRREEDGFAFDTPYTLLTAPGLSGLTADRFGGNAIEGVTPTFAIVGDALQVSFPRT